MSLTDDMTGLYNRRGFHVLAEQALREARRNRETLTVMFIDVDGLKIVNDVHGHDEGSKLISDVADLLKSTFRDADITARIGGDEFAVVFHDDAAAALGRLRSAVDRSNRRSGLRYVVSISVGVAATGPDLVETVDDLMARADAAMYSEKRRKRTVKMAQSG